MSPAVSPRPNDPILALPVEAKPLRIALFVLTALSAAAALFLEPALGAAVGRGALAPIWLFTPLAVYCVFLVAYAFDRVMLVRRRSYPAGKAFFQVIFGVVFGLVLVPQTVGSWKARPEKMAGRLVAHEDPAIRAIAIEAIGFRGFSTERIAPVVDGLRDPDPRVRTASAEVLARWSALDRSDVAALERWAKNPTVPTSSTSTHAP